LDHNSYAKHLIFLIRQIWLPQTFGFSGIWKEHFKGVHSTNAMNSCPLSGQFWAESIVRLWMWYFKNGWPDRKVDWWKWWLCW
jgi:hypothetical protein